MNDGDGGSERWGKRETVNPMTEGTMVEGDVPSTPPITPPNFSMASVTKMDTTPAKNPLPSAVNIKSMLIDCF